MLISKPHKRKKYGNKPVIIGELRFDSQKECGRWKHLCLLQTAGYISNLIKGPRFEFPIQYVQSKRFISYRADFAYTVTEKGAVAKLGDLNEYVVEDVKADSGITMTESSKIRIAMMKYFKNIDVKIV